MRLFTFLTLFLALVSSQALACKCLVPNDDRANESYASTEIVVKGEVQLISKGWGGSSPLATLKIKQVHKGNFEQDETIVIQYNPHTGACGTALKEGEIYDLGLHDVRSLDTSKPKVGDYRAVNACEQMSIQHYLENMKEEN